MKLSVFFLFSDVCVAKNVPLRFGSITVTVSLKCFENHNLTTQKNFLHQSAEK